MNRDPRKPRLFLCLLLGVVLLPQAAFADKIDPDNPPQGLFSDEWAVIELNGEKAGYTHTTMSRQDDRITTRVLMVFNVARAGQVIEISAMQSCEETVAGQPISLESSQNMGSTQLMSKQARVEGDKIEITSTQFGMARTETYTYPKGALMMWGIMAEQLRRGFEDGTAYELATYEPDMSPDKPVPMKFRVGKTEKIDLLGGSAEAVRVDGTIETPTAGTLDTVSWIDADGRTLVSVFPMPGIGNMRMISCDKATAVKQAPAPEFFINTMVKAGKKIDRQAAQRIRYRLRVTGKGDPLPDLPDTGMQKVKRQDDGSIEVEVTRLDHQALQSAKLAPPSDEMADYLEANIWLNSEDPEVVAMAKTAAAGATTPYQIADQLREYVSNIIEEKGLNVGFASASEVCRNKEGDCSEHAVLLAALGRVQHIPSRVVIGVVYVPRFAGESDVFGFHMWTQFHLGDEWVDFDAAMLESDCNPTHIALGVSSLKQSALMDTAFALLKIIGRLEIDLLEADPPTVIGKS